MDVSLRVTPSQASAHSWVTHPVPLAIGKIPTTSVSALSFSQEPAPAGAQTPPAAGAGSPAPEMREMTPHWQGNPGVNRILNQPNLPPQHGHVPCRFAPLNLPSPWGALSLHRSLPDPRRGEIERLEWL